MEIPKIEKIAQEIQTKQNKPNFKLSELTHKEKVFYLLLNGGAIQSGKFGDEDYEVFNISADFRKFPSGFAFHAKELLHKEGEEAFLNFVDSLSGEVEKIDESAKSEKSKPYVEFDGKPGQSCGPNCDCHPTEERKEQIKKEEEEFTERFSKSYAKILEEEARSLTEAIKNGEYKITPLDDI